MKCDDGRTRNHRAHSLRKAGATIAAERGTTVNMPMAIYGWETAKEAVHYTKQADQARLAASTLPLLGKIQEQSFIKTDNRKAGGK